MLFGKVKRIAEYDAGANLLEDKTYEYSSNIAYPNGMYRTVPTTGSFYYGERFIADQDGDYSTATAGTPYGVEDQEIHQYSGYQIQDASFLEATNPQLFYNSFVPVATQFAPNPSGEYMDSHFIPLTKETLTSYDYQLQKAFPISTTIVSAVGVFSPAASTKMMISNILAQKQLPPYVGIGMTAVPMTSITEYNYWDANALGISSCVGDAILLNGFPSTNNQTNLFYEPSWELYQKKTYSPQLPNAFKTEEHFYFHDLQNNYLQSSGDTVYGFDAYNFSIRYRIRNLAYEIRTTTKSQSTDIPFVKSNYFWYDARFVGDVTPVTQITDNTFYTPPTPSAQPPAGPVPNQCITPPTGSQANYPPPGYKLSFDLSGNPLWCPFVLDDPRLIAGPTTRREIIYPGIHNKIFLRKAFTQVDNAYYLALLPSSDLRVGNYPFTFTDAYLSPPNPNYICRFGVLSQTQPHAAPYIEPISPFMTLTSDSVIKVNNYGQPALSSDENGLLKTSVYTVPVDYTYTNFSSNVPPIPYTVHTNSFIGLPLSECQTGGESLCVQYQYNNDFSIQSTTDPNQKVMTYVYDEYGREKQILRNSVLLNINNYSNWQNDTTKSFSDRAIQNYVEGYTFNEVGLMAENSRSYIDPEGRKYDELTQVTPNYSIIVNSNPVMGPEMKHSGTAVYDNWNRVVAQYKPFIELSPTIFNPQFNKTTPNTTQQFENNQRSRLVRATKFGEAIHAVNNNYNLITGVQLITELALNSFEKGQLMPVGPPNQYTFLKTAVIDEDNKKTVTYTDGFKRTVATKTYSDVNTTAITLYAYNSQMQPILIINPNKQQIKSAYNMLGLIYQKIVVDADTINYMYNKKGQVVLEQDGIGRAGTDYSGQPWVRRYLYDVFGRLIGQEKDAVPIPAPGSTNRLLNPLFYNDCFDLTYPSAPVPLGQLEFHLTYATSLDYAYNIQKGVYSGNPIVGFIYSMTGGAYTNLSFLETEKELFYGNAASASSLSYLDPGIAGFFGKYPQQNLSGRLSYSLSYSGSNKINFCAYSYTPEGFLYYEAHQFNNNHLVNFRPTNTLMAIVYPAYNLRGSVKSKQVWNLGGNFIPTVYPISFSQDYIYDGWNRLQQVSANGNPIADYSYDDALGLLKTTNYYAAGPGGCQVPVDNIVSSFDVRDRLTSRLGKFYEERLFYGQNSPTILPAVYSVTFDGNYNGNINVAQSTYHLNVASNDPGTFTGSTYYGYKYDGMNRLTNADASVFDPLLSCPSITNATANNPALLYGDESITYDRIGNTLAMTRGTYYQSPCGSPNEVKHWAYQYQTNTNKLLAINSTVPPINHLYSYTYDASGNLRSDGRTQTTSITYTRDNAIQSLALNNEKPVSYLYDVDDDRIYSQDADDNETQFYLRDLKGNTIGISTNNVWDWNVQGLDHIATIQAAGTQYYEYDHLGDVRTTFTVSSLNCSGGVPLYSLNYVADYYAFGKILRSFVPNTDLDRYGFDGDEREKRISDNNYITKFRELDVEIGRWWRIDPLASKMNGFSPYCFAFNNPTHFVDIDGRVPGDPEKDKIATGPVDRASVGVNGSGSIGLMQLKTGLSKLLKVEIVLAWPGAKEWESGVSGGASTGSGADITATSVVRTYTGGFTFSIGGYGWSNLKGNEVTTNSTLNLGTGKVTTETDKPKEIDGNADLGKLSISKDGTVTYGPEVKIAFIAGIGANAQYKLTTAPQEKVNPIKTNVAAIPGYHWGGMFGMTLLRN